MEREMSKMEERIREKVSFYWILSGVLNLIYVYLISFMHIIINKYWFFSTMMPKFVHFIRISVKICVLSKKKIPQFSKRLNIEFTIRISINSTRGNYVQCTLNMAKIHGTIKQQSRLIWYYIKEISYLSCRTLHV